LIESRTLKQNCGANAENPAKLALMALGAFLEGWVVDRLEFVEVVIACVAVVFVRRHIS
jgi:hypothetical protein